MGTTACQEQRSKNHGRDGKSRGMWPLFQYVLAVWMVSTDKPRVGRQDKGDMIPILSPTQGHIYWPSTTPVPTPGPQDIAAHQQYNMYLLQQQSQHRDDEKNKKGIHNNEFLLEHMQHHQQHIQEEVEEQHRLEDQHWIAFEDHHKQEWQLQQQDQERKLW
jgi:hypothetical protein